MLNVLTKKLELDDQNARLIIPKSILLRLQFVNEPLPPHEQDQDHWTKFKLPELLPQAEKAIKSVATVLSMSDVLFGKAVEMNMEQAEAVLWCSEPHNKDMYPANADLPLDVECRRWFSIVANTPDLNGALWCRLLRSLKEQANRIVGVANVQKELQKAVDECA